MIRNKDVARMLVALGTGMGAEACLPAQTPVQTQPEQVAEVPAEEAPKVDYEGFFEDLMKIYNTVNTGIEDNFSTCGRMVGYETTQGDMAFYLVNSNEVLDLRGIVSDTGADLTDELLGSLRDLFCNPPAGPITIATDTHYGVLVVDKQTTRDGTLAQYSDFRSAQLQGGMNRTAEIGEPKMDLAWDRVTVTPQLADLVHAVADRVVSDAASGTLEVVDGTYDNMGLGAALAPIER